MKHTRCYGGLMLVGVLLVWAEVGQAKPTPPRKSPAMQRPKMQSAAKGKAAPKQPEHFPQRTVNVTKVNPLTHAQVLASAAKIDELVDANLQRRGLQPNPRLPDDLFYRRIHLDITGAIPSYSQIKANFIGRRNSDTWRSTMIDHLLSTDGYASHMFNEWADILRLRDEMLLQSVSAAAYNEWVRRAFEDNLPYDKFVHALLAAKGKYLEHPETGYVIKDSNMPLDAVNNTMRVFLGTQIGCAQCHNHPFEKWTQKEFYELAAFTKGLQNREPPPKALGKDRVKAVFDELEKSKKPNAAKPLQAFRQSLGANLVVVSDEKADLRLPKDYKYDDSKPGSVVQPRFLFGPEMNWKSAESRREAFADWVTSRENPRFTTLIVNRLWRKFFGAGLIEPVDDLREGTQAENPELLAFLEAEMRRVDYDLKEFQRIILHTKAYQREATSAQIHPGEEYHFPGPILRRMTAEQAWDSFVTLASFHDPREYHREPARVDTQAILLDLKTATADDIQKAQEAWQKGVRNDRARLKPYEYKGLHLVRASELPLPLPDGHFLREFGQSDHQEIESSHQDGSVLQALQMFNGPITHMLLDANSMMYKHVMAEKADPGRIDVIFMSVLTRPATPEQRKLALQEITRHGLPGYGNVIWALVNTPEFLFIQ